MYRPISHPMQNFLLIYRMILFSSYWNIPFQILQRKKSKKEANGKQSNCKEHRFITNHQSSFNVPYINLRNPGDTPIIYQFRYSSIFRCEQKDISENCFYREVEGYKVKVISNRMLIALWILLVGKSDYTIFLVYVTEAGCN